MADRVVFIPGFPYSFKAGVTDPTHPIAMSMEDIAQLKYRVKEWEISTDAYSEFVGGGGNTPAPNGAMTAFSPIPTRELGLLDANGHTFTLIYPSLPPESILLEYLITDNQVFNDAGTLYPYIDIHFPWSNPQAAKIQSNPTVGFGESVVGSVNGSIMGRPIPLYFVLPTGSTDVVNATFCDFIPIEYWPYAARDGSPIWDTTTGAQLQDPLNAL